MVYGQEYSCIIQNLMTSFENRTVTEIRGNHSNVVKTNDDVKMVFTEFGNSPYLPLNLGKFFPNLKVLYIRKSNVQHLMTGDLQGLDNLKIFDVSHNPVEQIGEDFFVGHEKLQKISFYDCHIKKINRGSLDMLTTLEAIFFDMNPCVDERFETYGSYRGLNEFVENLYDKCHGSDYVLKSNETINCAQVTVKNITRAIENIQPTSNTIYVIMLAITVIVNIVLGVMLFRVLRNRLNGNWNELGTVLL